MRNTHIENALAAIHFHSSMFIEGKLALSALASELDASIAQLEDFDDLRAKELRKDWRVIEETNALILDSEERPVPMSNIRRERLYEMALGSARSILQTVQ